MSRIADIQFVRVVKRLTDHHLTLEMDAGAKTSLAEEACEPQFAPSL